MDKILRAPGLTSALEVPYGPKQSPKMVTIDGGYPKKPTTRHTPGRSIFDPPADLNIHI